MHMKILAIETSCDDTAVALIECATKSCTGAVKNAYPHVLASVTASQIPLHRRYGGVVPEIAARAHAETLLPVIRETFNKAGFAVKSAFHDRDVLCKPPIDGIAVTSGPGLVTSLWVGVTAARTLAWLWKKPIYGVNHIIGHVFSSCIERPLPQFPALALVVSGGHTELLWLSTTDKWKKIGSTRDDAAGEAFDKCAKLINLPYPGGPEIARLGAMGKRDAINFPRPMINDSSYDFSFSGLKTSVRILIEKERTCGKYLSTRRKRDICASYEQAIVDVLVHKTMRAAKKLKPKTILLGGGVAANDHLRSTLAASFAAQPRISLFLPEKKFTMDNAAMIGAAACIAGKRFKINWRKLAAKPNFEVE